MPTITVQGPPVPDVDKKRTFVREVTAAAAQLYGFPPAIITVVIKENLPENVGVGGLLIIDRKAHDS